MATPSHGAAKTKHINMMTDTVIANLPADSLRSIIHAILATDPTFTAVFETQTRRYLQKTATRPASTLFVPDSIRGIRITEELTIVQQRVRCMLGCGLCYESLPLLKGIVEQVTDFQFANSSSDILWSSLTSVDGDIVQAITAMQKMLLVPSGAREISTNERVLLEGLQRALVACQDSWSGRGQEFPFERSLLSIRNMLNPSTKAANQSLKPIADQDGMRNGSPTIEVETFPLADNPLPRIFSGLWQLSSPAWGSAPILKMITQFTQHVRAGLTAFDMADHYGDAEIIFGLFHSTYEDPVSIFGATKYCVFHPMIVTREAVRANVTERCQRMQVNKIDLLQFHWQFYEDPQYLDALRYLQEDERVRTLGLCNFDTEHMKRVIASGVPIYTNQVQFSLIDSRPTVKMAEICTEQNIKLLTYGTLCGGFLSEKWLDQPEPEPYSNDMTPSQRKYLRMITSWGSWDLFQGLLRSLKSIALKHDVSISNVATRWVLDFPYVGAVIVGARMGVSEHVEDNVASYGWRLDEEDQRAIEAVLEESQRIEMFEAMGDCGGEYR